jgi:hypothetical protein
MTEYQFHWGPPGTREKRTSSVTLEAQSTLHGAALALRHFMDLGCDISAPLAHVDVTDPVGGTHPVLVEEVLDWLREPEQTAFVQGARLASLLQWGRV